MSTVGSVQRAAGVSGEREREWRFVQRAGELRLNDRPTACPPDPRQACSGKRQSAICDLQSVICPAPGSLAAE